MTAPQVLAVKCPECSSSKVFSNGHRTLRDGSDSQRYLCRECGYRFSDHTILNVLDGIERDSRICAVKVKNLTIAQEIQICAGLEKATELTIKGEIVQFPLYCKREGMQPSTVLTFNKTIRRLAKNANLHDTEAVKDFFAALTVDENTKVAYCIAYNAFLKSIGKTWKAPKYQYSQKLPDFLPTEQELDALIAGAGPKVGPLLQLIKETGMRLNECLSLTWICVNFDTTVITLTKAEKHSLPRVFKGTPKLLGMLKNLPRQNDKVFGILSDVTAESCLKGTRRKVAKNLCNPRIAKIHYHLIRHWYATMEYHKKPDIFHVSKLIGHKSVLSTQIYINMEKMVFDGPTDDYIVKVVETLDDAIKLMQVGFEFHCEMDGKKLFRKRK